MQKLVEDYAEKARAAGIEWEITSEVKARTLDANYRRQILSETGFPEYFGLTATDEDWETLVAIYEAQNAAGKGNPVVQTSSVSKYGATSAVGKNNVASLLKTFAIVIYIGGFISGIMLGKTMNYFTGEATFSIASALGYWIAFFVAGTMMYGFAEIVRLLQVIADK